MATTVRPLARDLGASRIHMSVYTALRVSPAARMIPRPESVIGFDPVLRLWPETDEKSGLGSRRWNVIFVQTAVGDRGYHVRHDGRLYRLIPETVGRTRCDFLSGRRLEVTDDFAWCRVGSTVTLLH